MQRLVQIDPRAPERKPIDDAVRVLRAGGLVAFPTETVYGLGARLADEKALARVFAAKGRPSGHPLIAHVAGVQEARALAASFSERAESLARAFWPGPLTLVVPRGPRVPAIATGGGASVAIRAPSHPVARALIVALGEALAAPSANRYQTLSPTRAEHVDRSLGLGVDMILDGGACPGGIESTVLDLTSDPPRVLRPGGVPIAALRAHLPDVVLAAGVVTDEQAVRASPGMDARHYAPRARLEIAPGREAAITRRRELGDDAALILLGGAAEQGALVRALPADPEGYGRELYATLHALDDAGARVIVVEAVPADEDWLAVRDRLSRASH